ncbi:transposase [Methylobacterium sp. BE186]|nr:transposase [Methylobacterium sp. BE186]
MLDRVAEAMLKACEAFRSEFSELHRVMLAIIRTDEVCRRLMTVPGVGALIAFTSSVDAPARFRRSKDVGALFGLTPHKHRSGETDIMGAVLRLGNVLVRTALFEVAHILLTGAVRFSALKRWAFEVATRRGMKRAKVALARKLAVVLYRMWVEGTSFHWGSESLPA